MKALIRMSRVFCSLSLAAACASARADVWQDCTAWYIGGSSTVGAFKAGDMTDIRHAAITNSPTHGGSMRRNEGVSNLCENVYSAASGRWFENQRTIYLPQKDGFVKDVYYKVTDNQVGLPFDATNKNYTLLVRVRLDETQPTNKTWVHVVDLGYNGGSDAKHAFAVRYYPETEQLGLVYNGGNGKPKYTSPTNDVCTSLRGKWLELSVSLGLKANPAAGKDSSTMRVGIGASGIDRIYASTAYDFPSGQSIPKEGKLYLGGNANYSGASTSACSARASYQMVAYWDRVLTDAEIVEAFKLQGPDGTAAQAPALLKIGDPAWNADVFSASFDGASATPSTDLQDLGKFPMKLAAGQTLNIPFSVPDTSTNLRQIVRLTVASDSGVANAQVKIDGNDLGLASFVPGKTVNMEATASLFTEGEHTLSLTRADGGADPMKLDQVEISGSWRLGWIDGAYKPFQSDTASSKGVWTNAVESLVTNDWPSFRGVIKSTRHSAFSVCLEEEDVATRRIYLRAKPYGMQSGGAFDCVVLANGEEVFRRIVSDSAPYITERFKPIVIPFSPSTLKKGENVFTFKVENDPVLDPPPKGTWLQFDYFELEVGKEPSGGVFFLR